MGRGHGNKCVFLYSHSHSHSHTVYLPIMIGIRFTILGVRSLAVARRSRHSETE